jgi:site-specific DNA-methyltransferase (adenine-specific)
VARPKRSFGKDSRGTPPELYAALDAEFSFTLDPCPYDDSGTAGASLWGKDGLAKDWRGHRVYCNPPYSDIGPWLAKHREADVTVYLLPVKTDLGWWHDFVMPHAAEVRLFRGRLRFVAMSGGAPFPSAVVVYRHDVDGPPRWVSIDRPTRAVALG